MKDNERLRRLVTALNRYACTTNDLQLAALATELGVEVGLPPEDLAPARAKRASCRWVDHTKTRLLREPSPAEGAPEDIDKA